MNNKILNNGSIGKYEDVTTSSLPKREFLYLGKPLQNIEWLVNDFNFYEIEADYFDDYGTKKHGKFYLKDLIIVTK